MSAHAAKLSRAGAKNRRISVLAAPFTHLAAADEIAAAAEMFLTSHELRRNAGAVLKARVATYYTSSQATEAYRQLYARSITEPALDRLSGAA